MERISEGRRRFLHSVSAAAFFPFVFDCGRVGTSAQDAGGDLLTAIKQNAIQDSRGEWWGAADAPANVSSRIVLASADADRAADRLAVSGTVYERDGRTPAPNILIYFYHTNANGIYGRAGENRHGKYRGWILTDAQGRYEFETIVPASYPNSTQSKHIHMTLTGKIFREDWYDSFLFEGDPLLTARERAPQRGGFDHVMRLEKRSGVLRGVRDIRLI